MTALYHTERIINHNGQMMLANDDSEDDDDHLKEYISETLGFGRAVSVVSPDLTRTLRAQLTEYENELPEGMPPPHHPSRPTNASYSKSETTVPFLQPNWKVQNG